MNRDLLSKQHLLDDQLGGDGAVDEVEARLASDDGKVDAVGIRRDRKACIDDHQDVPVPHLRDGPGQGRVEKSVPFHGSAPIRPLEIQRDASRVVDMAGHGPDGAFRLARRERGEDL